MDFFSEWQHTTDTQAASDTPKDPPRTQATASQMAKETYFGKRDLFRNWFNKMAAPGHYL